jgi:hypothetical protein
MLQVDLLHHSILGRRARVQSDDHHVQANLPTAKTTIHTMRNRNIETAKLACFLNSLATPTAVAPSTGGGSGVCTGPDFEKEKSDRKDFFLSMCI